MNDYLIKTENLSFTYETEVDVDGTIETHPALENVSIEIKRGEYVAVLGHNGSGKSTLAKLLNLILIPSSGKIFVDGKDVSAADLSEDEVFEVRTKIGMVFQNPDNQLVATGVEEDVAFGPENLGLPREEIRRRVVDAVNRVGMQDYMHHAPHKLSGGQKQRIAIAGIIAMKPDCIVFDEATAMLDPFGRRDCVEIMESLCRNEGITVINITHYMEEAARADRVIVINDGKVVLDGTPNEVFSNVDYLHSIGLEAPQGTELIYGLRDLGLNINDNDVSNDRCTQILYDYLSSLKEN